VLNLLDYLFKDSFIALSEKNVKPLTHYEPKSDPLLPFDQFLSRLMRHGLATLLLLAVSLGIGLVGYHLTENLPWIDSLLNASILLGGMRPADMIRTEGGKLFASFHAFFARVAFLLVVGIIIAPLAHRLMHRLHLKETEE
jgi:hypothetical protein